MKKLVLSVALCLATTAVIAEDFEKSQHNFRLRSGDYGIEIREEFKSQKDHIQLMYYGVKNFEIRYRYVDNLTGYEHRPQISYLGLDNGTIYVKPRIDYRYFEGPLDNYISIRTIFGVNKRINGLKYWAEAAPIWNIGNGKEEDVKIDSVQFKVGIDYIDNQHWSFGPYVQYETNQNLEKTDVFLGTMILINI